MVPLLLVKILVHFWNGIRHKTSAPYHPASNGLAERAVEVVKAGLRKNKQGRIDLRLAQILVKYRLKPPSTTGVTPVELLIGRKTFRSTTS